MKKRLIKILIVMVVIGLLLFISFGKEKTNNFVDNKNNISYQHSQSNSNDDDNNDIDNKDNIDDDKYEIEPNRVAKSDDEIDRTVEIGENNNKPNETQIDINYDKGSKVTISNEIDKSMDNNINKKVPILCYHAVSNEIDGIYELFVSPEEFDQQMKFLKDNNYSVIRLEEYEDAINYDKPVILTFDDGYRDNYTNAYKILKKYNYPATIFIIAGAIGNEKYLTKEQMIEMSDLVSFQSHTVTHPNLDEIDLKSIEKEYEESNKIIKNITNNQVIAIAYPVSRYNQQVLEITKKYYRYGFILDGGLHTFGMTPLTISRIYMYRDMGINKLKTKMGVNY